MYDSDSGPEYAPKTAKSSGQNIKPQIAKKLRKEKRQQKLLQQLDKQSYQKSQEAINAKIEESSSWKKRKKHKTKDRVQDAPEAPTTVSTNNGREYTVSIAVAGSILDNAQTPQLKAYLAGQVARAAGIFNVDEIIVYDDTGGNCSQACELMARNLQYVETPPYLRKYMFELHPDLQYTGLIAPLDIPHHLRKHEALPFREGMVSTKPTKEGMNVSYIYVGLDRDCRVERKLPEGVRVTVKFEDPSPDYILKPKGKLRGTVVSPSVPRTQAGLYWGYTVRIASGLSQVFSEAPFKNGDSYDLTIGTSEKGYPLKDFKIEGSKKHILIVFGGVEGLEYALENDETTQDDDVSRLFHHYINTCPDQGSRTIRTEEAILISLTSLSNLIRSSCC